METSDAMRLSCPTFEEHLGPGLEVERLKRISEALRKVAAAQNFLVLCLISVEVGLAHPWEFARSVEPRTTASFLG